MKAGYLGRGCKIMQKRIKTPTTCSINKTIEALFALHLHVIIWRMMKTEHFDILQENAIVYCYHLKITSFMNTKWTKDFVKEAQHNGKSFPQGVRSFSAVLFWLSSVWIWDPLVQMNSKSIFVTWTIVKHKCLIFDMNYITMWIECFKASCCGRCFVN